MPRKANSDKTFHSGSSLRFVCVVNCSETQSSAKQRKAALAAAGKLRRMRGTMKIKPRRSTAV
jgi:hypothetical protein